MPIEFHCQSCRNLLRVPDESAGKMAKCPSCGTVTLVPAAGGSASDQDDLQLAPLPTTSLAGPPPGVRGTPQQYVPPGDASGSVGPSGPDMSNPYASPQVSDYGRSQAGQMSGAAVRAYAHDRVSGPATALLIVGWIAVVAHVLFSCYWSFGTIGGGGVGAAVNLVFHLFDVAIYGCMIFGATQMKNLASYGWSMSASILALLPTCLGCCFLALPFGIWSLIVLNDPQVRAGFQ